MRRNDFNLLLSGLETLEKANDDYESQSELEMQLVVVQSPKLVKRDKRMWKHR